MPFEWDVQPYEYVSELVNRYTNTIIATTIGKYTERAVEIEAWMKANAPWSDRTPEMRDRAARIIPLSASLEADTRKRRSIVPERHAREALSARPHVEPNVQRMYEGMRREAFAKDEAQLKFLNKRRAWVNESQKRSPSRQLKPLAALPKARQRGLHVEQKIRVMRGPIMELKMSHGSDIWYGIWLEIAHQGRYSIIDKTIDHWSDILMKDIKQIANLKQYNITFDDTVVTDREVFEEFVAEQNEIHAFNKSPKRYQPWTPEKAARVRARRKRENRRLRRLRMGEIEKAEESVAPLKKEDDIVNAKRAQVKTQPVLTFNPKTGKRTIIRK